MYPEWWHQPLHEENASIFAEFVFESLHFLRMLVYIKWKAPCKYVDNICNNCLMRIPIIVHSNDCKPLQALLHSCMIEDLSSVVGSFPISLTESMSSFQPCKTSLQKDVRFLHRLLSKHLVSQQLSISYDYEKLTQWNHRYLQADNILYSTPRKYSTPEIENVFVEWLGKNKALFACIIVPGICSYWYNVMCTCR